MRNTVVSAIGKSWGILIVLQIQSLEEWFINGFVTHPNEKENPCALAKSTEESRHLFCGQDNTENSADKGREHGSRTVAHDNIKCYDVTDTVADSKPKESIYVPEYCRL